MSRTTISREAFLHNAMYGVNQEDVNPGAKIAEDETKQEKHQCDDTQCPFCNIQKERSIFGFKFIS